MADDVLIQPASGVGAVPVAADEIAGTKHQRAKIQHGADGSATDVSAASPLPVAQQGAALSADGAANPSAPAVRAASELWNGAGWDRQRGNGELGAASVLASAARTITTDSPILTNHNGRGVHVVLTTTAVGTGTLTLQVRGVAPNGGNYLIGAGSALSTSGVWTMAVYPGATAALSTGSVAQAVARRFIVRVVSSDGSSWTYSAEVSLIV